MSAKREREATAETAWERRADATSAIKRDTSREIAPGPEADPIRILPGQDPPPTPDAAATEATEEEEAEEETPAAEETIGIEDSQEEAALQAPQELPAGIESEADPAVTLAAEPLTLEEALAVRAKEESIQLLDLPPQPEMKREADLTAATREAQVRGDPLAAAPTMTKMDTLMLLKTVELRQRRAHPRTEARISRPEKDNAYLPAHFRSI